MLRDNVMSNLTGVADSQILLYQDHFLSLREPLKILPVQYLMLLMQNFDSPTKVMVLIDLNTLCSIYSEENEPKIILL